ncbi:MAG: SPASM domain-containing protein [Ignavibacteriales bacterium]|nr:SPASM domain-containing protein [Ignavibacteriales bacterium]
MHQFFYAIPKITLKRALNYAKVMGSFWVSKRLKRPVVWGLPIFILYEPTNYCNLRCPECPTGTRELARPEGMVDDLTSYKKLIDELGDRSFLVQLYFQGESYLNPRFFDMIAYAERFNLFTETSTNAHFLTDENCRKTIEAGLDRLVISIDGTTQDVFEKYRVRGSLQKVLEGTRRLIEWKRKLRSRKPYTVFQFIVFSHNEHQIADVKRLGKEIGVNDVTIKSAQIYQFEKKVELMPKENRYSRYEKNNGEYHIKSDLGNHCWYLWHTANITWDNKSVPCCFDKSAKYEIGNIADGSFEELWRSKKYQQFRQAILHGRKNIDICQNCTEGLKVFVG